MPCKLSIVTVFALANISSAMCQQLPDQNTQTCNIDAAMAVSNRSTMEQVETLKNSRLTLVGNALDVLMKYDTKDKKPFKDLASPEDMIKLDNLRKQILQVNAYAYILDERNRDIQIIGGILQSDMESGIVKPQQDARQIHIRESIEVIKKQVGSALKPLDVPDSTVGCDFNLAVLQDYRVIIRKLVQQMREMDDGIEWLGSLYDRHPGENGNIKLEDLSEDEQQKYRQIQNLDVHSALTVGVLSDLGVLQHLYALSGERFESEKNFLDNPSNTLSSIEDLDKAFYGEPRDGVESMAVSVLQYIMEKYPSNQAISIKLFERLLDPNRHY